MKSTACAALASYTQNSGEFFQSPNGDIWKGGYNISRSGELVDEIKEVTGVSDGNRCVKEIVGNLGILIRKEREILALAAEIGDDGTQDMINPYISEQEKNLWMLRAYLSE